MKMPLIGLGTWKLNGKECETTVQKALEIGYRHIDTADAYQNHKEIGQAIKSWPRKELFLTSKIYLNDLSPHKVKQVTPRFLEELQVDYLDLLLIHWPNPDVALEDTLQAMLELKNQGMVRLIGVSNFVRSHIEQLAPRFPIFNNQIELHPYLQRKDLVQTCKKFGITITAYRPLAQGKMENDPILQKIGAKFGKTASQVTLRWIIQQGMATIPKASNWQHLRDNFNIFDFHLDKKEMAEIDQLDRGIRFCAPAGFPVFED